MRINTAVILSALGVSVFCAGQGRAEPNKYALLIGIDKYKYPNVVSPLAGSVNDIEDMKAVLIGKFDFPPANILVLKNEQATHAAIISAMQNHLIAKAQKDDIVVMDYSGHGSQMKDVTGKKISGTDETIVPYDSRDPQGKVFDISGTELHALLRQLSAKTRNITFVLDSCHSGTLIRDLRPGRARVVAPDERTPPPLPAYATGERGLHDVADEPVPPFALIAAATSKEVAFEHVCHGQEHGALTCFLTQQLRIAKPQDTWRDVMDVVTSNVNANYPMQHPQLEGAQADQQIFGVTVTTSKSYVLASPLDKVRVTLGQGAVSGMTAGSTFDIFRPGAKNFAGADKPTGLVQVTSVTDFTSEAKLVSGGPVLQDSRAVERVHRYGKSRLRLYLHGKETSNTLQALSKALAALPQMELVDSPARCNLQLEERDGRVLILTADGRTTSNPVGVNDADAVEHLTREMQSWAKWFNGLSVRPAVQGPQLRLKVKVGQGAASRDPFQSIGKADATVSEGDKVTLDITNQSDHELYIAMLDFSTDGSISQIYPTVDGASEVLRPGLTLTRTFTAFVPKGRSSVNDFIKVFGSTKPIGLAPLTQGTIREIVSDPLSDLLAEAAGQSRGLAPDDSAAIHNGASNNPAAGAPDATRLADWNETLRMLLISSKNRK